MPRTFFIALVLSICVISQAKSQNVCGNPPELPTKAEDTEKIKGALDGKAQFLSRFVGEAGLSGKINNERKTIYQSADKISAAQQDAYLAYMFCTVIMDDRSLSTKDKIKAIQEFKRPISMRATEEFPDELAFDQIHDLEIQAAGVDDRMWIKINGQIVEDASFGVPTPWRDIIRRVGKGANVIQIDIYNDKYGGCSGTLRLRVNHENNFTKTWSVPMERAPYQAICATEVMTLNLE